jgi:D-3-phosphoglycerate dehydrogenase
MTTNILLCGDPQQPSQYMHEAMSPLKEYDVSFREMNWMGDSSPEEFRNKTMEMESRGPESYDTYAIQESLSGIDILIVHKAPVPREVIESSTSLQIVGAARGGTENVDVEAAENNNVTILHAPGRNRDAVADYAVALLLSYIRKIPFNHVELSNGKWDQVFNPDQLPPDLPTSTIGIVGFGHIGRGVAQRLSGFGPEILVHDPYVGDEEIRDLGLEPLPLTNLLSRTNAVSLHVRLSKETAELIGSREFEIMKSSAFLVNTARGGLVDENALINAIQDGKIAGAALDVFQQEPLPDDHPLLALETVILTPHVAGSTRDAVLGGPRILASELESKFKGREFNHAL